MASSVTFPLTKPLEGEACANRTKNVLFRVSNRKFQTQFTGKLYYFILCRFLEARDVLPKSNGVDRGAKIDQKRPQKSAIVVGSNPEQSN
ncbi:unnamed protein product [Acanthoscelides obtectus]|uniref:Uncharacterized protein n=1 Tax=Acanthoscelides obtectus TaxID=200917 RepID=A0A9P0M6Q0_ACAOB|nr:unnamed protein product [Acanthoscelides obtectus]CAK1626097.1 hypothetical protein AOBTE_LOCUS3607 [Acanthoscelides obtectus]